ncbi:MAG: glycosyltransferase family 2 protein [Candidatus Andersenbacteria bacterium]|nr:glycosyltransferase family 2 protein [Candidatus Andersenbacteria bacterium]
MKYSIIVPAKNEQDSIKPLYKAVKAVMMSLPGDAHGATGSDGPEWEMIVIDDGSDDQTLHRLLELRKEDARVKIIRFRRSFGQTAAWSAGFDIAQGDYVIVLDADLQNDPADIPAMLTLMNREGLDVVSGWRRDRKDKGWLKIGSRIGNAVHRWMTGEKIHDHGCSLKVYKKEALKDLELYGEMHRYITALLTWKGFRVGEMVVRHNPRAYGSSNYTVRKKLKGFLDLLIVKFWIQYSARPMHFFGAIGSVFILVGFILGGTLGILWLLRIIGLDGRSTPLLAVLLVLLGFQFLLTGVLADVVAHTYYAQKKAYSVLETIGFE